MSENSEPAVRGRPRGQSYPFRAWRTRLGLAPPEAARLLGRDERMIRNYDKLIEISRPLALAMQAIEHLPSWRLREIGIDPYWREGQRSYRLKGYGT